MTAAHRTAEELGTVVVLKGSSTVCAVPDGRTLVQIEAGPELTTASSGYTLAGFVGSVLARVKHGGPTATVEKATAASWLHGRAGLGASARGPFKALSLR